MRPARLLPALLVLLAAAVSAQQQDQPQAFRFRTGVELVNVNATVTDQSGRFVPGLRQSDFQVFDDETAQPITHFNPERVPVSLGILLDTSGSMDGEKIVAARAALNRFLDLLDDPKDEVFLYRFDNDPQLVEGWTYDKRQVSDALARMMPHGGTAMYDAVVDALQLVQQGHNTKKALVIISDGNDTSSHSDVYSVKQLIRESEALVYAIGIDAGGAVTRRQPLVPAPAALFQRGAPPRPPMPSPFPIPGRKPAPPAPPQPLPPISNPSPNPSGKYRSGGDDDRVNVAALRDITDDSGGRTEIVRFARDLDPATAGIADELSRQYYLGYPAPGAKDGRWHTIRVEVRNPAYHVRARRGYVAAK